MSVLMEVGQTLSLPIVVTDEDPDSCEVIASAYDGSVLTVEGTTITSVVVTGLIVGETVLGITVIDGRGGATSVDLTITVKEPDEAVEPPPPVTVIRPILKTFAKAPDVCTPLRLGRTNDVPDMALTAEPDPATPIDNIKNEFSARIARFLTLRPTNDIVIEGTHEEDVVCEYFALPDSRLPAASEIRLELFDAAGLPVHGFSVDNLLTETIRSIGRFRFGVDEFGGEPDGKASGDWRSLSSLVPIGRFRFGIDKFGGIDPKTQPATFLVWFRKLYAYRSFRLTIRSNLAAGSPVDIRIRMMLIGQKLELENGFNVGESIRYVTPPQQARTEDGSTLMTRPQARARALSLPMRSLTRPDHEALSEMESDLLGKAFVVSGYPAETGRKYSDHNFLGRFGDALNHVNTAGPRHAIPNCEILEV